MKPRCTRVLPGQRWLSLGIRRLGTRGPGLAGQHPRWAGVRAAGWDHLGVHGVDRHLERPGWWQQQGTALLPSLGDWPAKRGLPHPERRTTGQESAQGPRDPHHSPSSETRFLTAAGQKEATTRFPATRRRRLTPVPWTTGTPRTSCGAPRGRPTDTARALCLSRL